MINFGPYGKTITALITGLIGWFILVTNSAQAHITSQEWIALAIALATAVGVYAVGNGAPE
jgi:hypothetical protein